MENVDNATETSRSGSSISHRQVTRNRRGSSAVPEELSARHRQGVDEGVGKMLDEDEKDDDDFDENIGC